MASPGWALGRAGARGIRPFGRPRLGSRPGARGARRHPTEKSAGDDPVPAALRGVSGAKLVRCVGGGVAMHARRREGGSVATRACLTRTAVADGRRPLARRRGCRGGGGRGSCPGERGAHQQLAEEVGEARRGRQRPNSLARPAAGGGENRDGEVDWGVPGPIPCSRGNRSARRSSWQGQLASGWSESTAGATMAAAAGARFR